MDVNHRKWGEGPEGKIEMKKVLAILMAALMLFGAIGFAAEEAKPVILVVSFGTSYNDSRDATIGAIEAAIQAAYPDYEVRRAFTAQTIIDKLAERDGLEIDNVQQAMDRLAADGVRRVIVQPTHIMNGYEYDDMVAEVTAYAEQFDFLAIGEPLLTGEADYEYVVEALLADNPHVAEEGAAIVYMGHGTEHYANASYSELEYMMHASGYENAFVGTVEGYPGLDEVIAKLDACGAQKVALYPLMVVAGDHANNDMAGDEEDSWKTILTEAGFEVTCVLEGMGQNPAICQRYVEHVQAAMDGGGYAAPAAVDMEMGACDAEKKAIVVVSFGTSYNDSREKTIDAIEADIAAAYPDWDVYRAFTAQTIIDKLAERDGLEIDNVRQVMERLIAEGYGTVAVQPTHVMNGYEYDDVVEEVRLYGDYFASLAIGEPLLTAEEDYEAVIDALLSSVEEAGDPETAIVYMGHGTEHFANATYSQMAGMMQAEGYENVFVGTVEGFPTLDNVIAEVSASGAAKVILYPFMVVAGDHANNDMAGDEEDSWKTAFEAAGFEVECRIQGMGENADIRAIYVDHLADAIASAGL